MRSESYVIGSSEPDLLELTIGEALEGAARRWPDIEAIVSVHQGIRWTYRELHRQANRFARGLRSLGIESGDRVAIWAPNCVEWLVAQLGTAISGVVLVNMNPAYRESEAAYTLKKVEAKLLIAIERVKSSNYVEIVEDLLPWLSEDGIRDEGGILPALRTVVKIGGPPRRGWLDFDELYQLGDDYVSAGEPVSGRVGRTDPVNIQFTSGTTGAPKGATLSHRNILNNGFFVGRSIGLGAGDRVCIPVPLYHCFGMVMGNLACLTHGATMVYPSPTFDPLAVLQAVHQERCTALYGVPTMFISVLQHERFASFTLSTLRTGIMAGAPCPEEVMRQVMDRMHMSEITIAYGMTETSPVSFQSHPTDPVTRRVETVGRIQPHLESKIVDAAGLVVPLGEAGELCTRGYSVMLGYWGDEEATRAAIDEDGWMHSGDLAVIDEEGYCRIVGRIKDMVIRGGENIYPREIEEFLYRHPDIIDVSVVGVSDETYGEELCAWIKVKDGAIIFEEDIKAFCMGKIAHYKIPKHVRFVDSFPLTATGKIQKFQIRQVMNEELGGSKTHRRERNGG